MISVMIPVIFINGKERVDMRNNKKITALVLCLCMLLLIVPVTGNAETLYSFEDDFSSYSNAMYTSFGTAMQQNWRTPTSGECDRSAINMGYNDGKLKISTNTVTTDVKYTTGNSLVFPCAVLTAGRDDLLPGQKISVKAKKTHFSDMWGVRFYVHNGNNGTLNYYTLLIGGMYTYAVSGGRLTWGLYKCTNGTVTTLTESVWMK